MHIGWLDLKMYRFTGRTLHVQQSEGDVIHTNSDEILRTQVFDHVQRQPLAFFTRAPTGSLAARVNTSRQERGA